MIAACRRFVLRLYRFLGSGPAERELAREMASHLALLEEDFLKRGMSSEEAKFAAKRAMGGIEQAKECQRDARSSLWLEDVRRDVLYAVRSLRRTPSFTIIAILTLALGIGANSAIFSVVNAVLLRPLPYPESDRLVRFVEKVASDAGRQLGYPQRLAGVLTSDLATFRSQATTLSHVGVYDGMLMMVTGRAEPLSLETTRVSPAVFAMLGVRPHVGRIFEAHEETPGADAVVLLSHGAWQRHFNGAPDVLGQIVTLDRRAFSIVGVMPQGFQFSDPQTQLWIPYPLGTRQARLPPIARLADGVSNEAASAQVDGLLRQLYAASRPPDTPAPSSPGGQGRAESGYQLETLHEQLVAPVRPALAALVAAVGFVLLIACVNVVSLALARTAARQREIVLRRMLGATRGRLVRQLLTESLLLAVAGGAVGIGVAFSGLQLLYVLGSSLSRRDLTPGVSIPRLDEIGIDLPVMAYTLVLAVVAGVMSGLTPAFRQSSPRETETLRGAGASAPSGFTLLGRCPTQGLLVVAEIGMAMMLLVGSGLLMQSFFKLSAVDTGYDPTGVLTFNIYSRRPPEELVGRLQALPPVRAAGYAELMPLVRFRSGIGIRPAAPMPPGSGPASPGPIDSRTVSWDFLRALGVRVIEGRGLEETDGEGQPRVMLINRRLARSGFLGPAPVGTLVSAGPFFWKVVGIVDDVHHYGLDQQPDAQVFFDARQLPMGNPYPYFAVRVDGDPMALASSVRAIVRQIDPQAIVANVATMEEVISNSISRPRLYAVLLGIFAASAGVLAAIGIYGLLAYSVAQRTREIGIRMALGAKRSDVLGLILRQSLSLAAVGILFGLAGAAAATRYLEKMLFGITPLDLGTFVAVPLLFGLVATLASYVPARRATKVDPLVALRCE